MNQFQHSVPILPSCVVSGQIIMPLSDVLFAYPGRTWLTVIGPAFFITYWAVWIIYARTLHPLAKIPGPFWPSVSRTWLIYRAYCGDLEIHQRRLHEQYGPLLRVAPGKVIMSVAKMLFMLTLL